MIYIINIIYIELYRDRLLMDLQISSGRAILDSEMDRHSLADKEGEKTLRGGSFKGPLDHGAHCHQTVC